MDKTLQRSLIVYGSICAVVGVVCIFIHAYNAVLYLGIVGALVALAGGIVAWDTKRRENYGKAMESLGKQLDSDAKEITEMLTDANARLDKSKE